MFAGSLIHLVCSQQHRLRNREAERLGGLHVDHELELRRLLDREVGWLRALEDFVYVRRRTPPEISEAGAVEHEPPDIHENSHAVNCRQPMSRCELRDLVWVTHQEKLSCDDQRGASQLAYRGEHAVDLV